MWTGPTPLIQSTGPKGLDYKKGKKVVCRSEVPNMKQLLDKTNVNSGGLNHCKVGM